MNRCDLDPGAARAHVEEAALEVLERRKIRALRTCGLAAQSLPETFHHFRRDSHDQHWRQAGEVIGPRAELGEPANLRFGLRRTPRLSARPAGALPCTMDHR